MMQRTFSFPKWKGKMLVIWLCSEYPTSMDASSVFNTPSWGVRSCLSQGCWQPNREACTTYVCAWLSVYIHVSEGTYLLNHVCEADGRKGKLERGKRRVATESLQKRACVCVGLKGLWGVRGRQKGEKRGSSVVRHPESVNIFLAGPLNAPGCLPSSEANLNKLLLQPSAGPTG